jgi:hypothetical protein
MTGYGLYGRDTNSSRVKIFLFFTTYGQALVPNQPPIQRVPGAIVAKVKLPGREANHSLSSSTEVKNGGVIPPLPHISSWHSA